MEKKVKKEEKQVKCSECLYANRLATCRRNHKDCAECKKVCVCKKCDSGTPAKAVRASLRPGYDSAGGLILEENKGFFGIKTEKKAEKDAVPEKKQRKRTAKVSKSTETAIPKPEVSREKTGKAKGTASTKKSSEDAKIEKGRKGSQDKAPAVKKEVTEKKKRSRKLKDIPGQLSFFL